MANDTSWKSEQSRVMDVRYRGSTRAIPVELDQGTESDDKEKVQAVGETDRANEERPGELGRPGTSHGYQRARHLNLTPRNCQGASKGEMKKEGYPGRVDEAAPLGWEAAGAWRMALDRISMLGPWSTTGPRGTGHDRRRLDKWTGPA